jgi:hypothetical protein
LVYSSQEPVQYCTKNSSKTKANIEQVPADSYRVYRTILINILEIEAYILPIDLYLDSQLAAFQKKLTGSKVEQFIKNIYKQIQAKIRNRRR